MSELIYINNNFIEQNSNFNALIEALKLGFSNSDIIVPQRHHHDFPNPSTCVESTLLLMPAWHPSKNAGVKIVTVSPENAQFNLPSIQGIYAYFDAINGTIKAIIDAKSLTTKRTAATSALASSYLSRENSTSLLMIGTGALSINLIKAHASVRPLKKIFVWGRHFEKAKQIAQSLKNETFTIEAIETYDKVIHNVDIISCATLSKNPLILGDHIKEGQHIDLVGAYKKDMREADDGVILKSSVFIDTYQGANESGDINIPLKKGILKDTDIKGDLFELTSLKKPGRQHQKDITVFKSVGHAIEDLIAANYYYNKYTNAKYVSKHTL